MSSIVHVTNVAPTVTEESIREFFSFCGKIHNLTVERAVGGAESTQTATVTFEKDSAAKTALLLDETMLGTNLIHVTSAATSVDSSSMTANLGIGARSMDDVSQEDKPRGRVIAEYLAHGYVISDKVIERALKVDQEHGLSIRFTAALKNFEEWFLSVAHVQKIDPEHNISDRAVNAYHGMHSYFDKVLGTPTGQKLRAFYEAGNKQVLDVHNEARHLADLQSSKSAAGAGYHTGTGNSGARNVDPLSHQTVDSEKSKIHAGPPSSLV